MMYVQLQPRAQQGEPWIELAKQENMTYEVSELSFPDQDEETLQKKKEWYQNSGLVTSLHGAFIDLAPSSKDPLIREVSGRRYRESMDLAMELGAKRVVFHCTAFPVLRGDYLEQWVKREAAFFDALLADYPEITICIENSLDLDPEPIYLLMRASNHPRLRVCLDVGHINYSKEPLETWFGMLRDYITYIHLSDNFGILDDHLPLGIGTVPLKIAEELVQGLGRDLYVTLETGDLEQTKKSIRYLKEKELFCWRPKGKQISRQPPARLSADEKSEIREMKREESRTKLMKNEVYLQKIFRRYLSDDIVSVVLNDPNGADLGGKKRRVAILNSDLRGFTEFCEDREPQEVIEVLNHYFFEMSEVIHRFSGTIIDMVGDGMLVAFGLFEDGKRHERDAVEAAKEMQRAMPKVNDWQKERGYPDLLMGIGIDTGEVVVGNIGSHRHVKFGIVGQHVNLASRIEGYTRGGDILISEATLHGAGCESEVEESRRVLPKGIAHEINIYAIRVGEARK